MWQASLSRYEGNVVRLENAALGLTELGRSSIELRFGTVLCLRRRAHNSSLMHTRIFARSIPDMLLEAALLMLGDQICPGTALDWHSRKPERRACVTAVNTIKT